MSETKGKASLTCLLAIAEVEASKLEDENDTMRQQLADVTESMGRAEERCAKLRELCADLYAEMIIYSDAPSYNASVWAPKLQELGIEVD